MTSVGVRYLPAVWSSVKSHCSGKRGAVNILTPIPKASILIPQTPNHKLLFHAGAHFPAGQGPIFQPHLQLPGPQVPYAPYLYLLLGPSSQLPASRPKSRSPFQAPGPTILTAQLCGTFFCSNGSRSRPNPSLSTSR